MYSVFPVWKNTHGLLKQWWTKKLLKKIMTFTSMYWLISHLGIPSFEDIFLFLYLSRIAHGFEQCPKSMLKIYLRKNQLNPLFGLDVQCRVQYVQRVRTLQLWDRGVRFRLPSQVSPYPQQKTEHTLFWPNLGKKPNQPNKKVQKDCSQWLCSKDFLPMPLHWVTLPALCVRQEEDSGFLSSCHLTSQSWI